MSTSHKFTQFYKQWFLAGSIKYIITNNRDFSLLQPVVKDFLEKTAVNNVTIIVTRRLNVIDLQENATEDVNQDGQGSLVMMLVKNRTMEQIVQINVEQTVSTIRVIM